MWPSQCGVPWETTKPPRKTLLPAGGNTPSRPQSPGTAGRGHSAGPAPAHGDTITLNSSCGRKRGDSPGQKKTHEWVLFLRHFLNSQYSNPTNGNSVATVSYFPWHFKFSRFWALYQLCSHIISSIPHPWERVGPFVNK